MQLIIAPERNHIESIREVKPGSTILPMKNKTEKNAPTKIDISERINPKITKILSGLSENETITLNAKDNSLEKL